MTGRRGVNPTVRRRRLGAELRRYREAAGMTIDQVAERLECSASKISRLETGQTGSSPRDVRDILAIYQVGETELEVAPRGGPGDPPARLVAAVRIGAHQRIHRVRGGGASDPLVRGAMRAGPAADRGLRPGVIPPAERDGRQIKLRTASGSGWSGSALLTQDDPVDFWCVLDEAALLRPVGGRTSCSATRALVNNGGTAQCHAPGAAVGDRCPRRHGRVFCLAAAFRTRATRTRCTSRWPPAAFSRRSRTSCAATRQSSTA